MFSRGDIVTYRREGFSRYGLVWDSTETVTRGIFAYCIENLPEEPIFSETFVPTKKLILVQSSEMDDTLWE